MVRSVKYLPWTVIGQFPGQSKKRSKTVIFNVSRQVFFVDFVSILLEEDVLVEKLVLHCYFLFVIRKIYRILRVTSLKDEINSIFINALNSLRILLECQGGILWREIRRKKISSVTAQPGICYSGEIKKNLSFKWNKQ